MSYECALVAGASSGIGKAFLVPLWTTPASAPPGKKRANPRARQGIDVPLSGKDHVYAASFKTKLEGADAKLVPATPRSLCT